MEGRKILIIISVIVLFFAGKLIFGAVYDTGDGGEEGKQKKKEAGVQVQETEERAEVEYENIEGLYFLNEAGWQDMKESLEAWCKKEGVRLQHARVHPVVENMLPAWVFYMDLNNGEGNVKGTYEDGAVKFDFISGLPETGTAAKEGKEEELKGQMEGALSSYDPNIDNPELGGVTVLNMPDLPEGIDGEGLALALEKKFQSAGEYRRELVYEKEDKTENHHWLWFSFVNPRTDGKWVRASIDEDGSFLVFIREAEKEGVE